MWPANRGMFLFPILSDMYCELQASLPPSSQKAYMDGFSKAISGLLNVKLDAYVDKVAGNRYKSQIIREAFKVFSFHNYYRTIFASMNWN